MIELHAAAVKARLDEDAALSGKGYEAIRTDPEGRLVRDTYWVLYFGGPDELGGDRAIHQQVPSDNAVFEFPIRCVAPDVPGVRSVAQHVTDQLVGAVLTIQGRRCRPIKLVGSSVLRADPSVKPPLPYLDLTFELRSFFVRGGC